MGTKNNPGKFDCFQKAKDDEPTFTLLGRDPQSGARIRDWATAFFNDIRYNQHRMPNPEELAKFAEAKQVAKDMDAYCILQGGTPLYDGNLAERHIPIGDSPNE